MEVYKMLMTGNKQIKNTANNLCSKQENLGETFFLPLQTLCLKAYYCICGHDVTLARNQCFLACVTSLIGNRSTLHM